MRAGWTETAAGEAAVHLEQRLLATFWAAKRQGADPLLLLLEFTRITIIRPQSWSTEAIRQQHRKNFGAPDTVVLERPRCFGCGGSGQLYAHHIIEIQYGGSNSLRNQVPLCFDCHQFLHPWLTEDDRIAGKPSTSFESLGEIFARKLGP